MARHDDYGRTGDRLGGRWMAAFLALAVVAHEAHELGHTVAGRLLCGRWAVRDFSNWSIDGCDSLWPCATGPLVSYLLMGLGAWLAWRKVGHRLGLALLFAANPLARIVTVATGRGDELVVARALAASVTTSPAIHAATLGLTLLLAGTALVAGWRGTAGLRRRGPTFLALAFAAIVITGPGLGAVNRLLHAGVLDRPVAGAPVLVHLVTLAAIAGLAVTARGLVGGRTAAAVGRGVEHHW